MKLKRILSAIIAFGVVASCLPTFAAETNHLELGTPYDVTTQEYTSDLVAGHIIAIPVNITSITDKLENYSIAFDYDPNILTPGVKDTDLTDDQYNDLLNFGAIETQTSGMDYNVNGFYTSGRFGNTAIGTTTINAETYDTGLNDPNMKGFFISWFTAAGQDVKADAPENLLIFTVNKAADGLNAEIIKLATDRCLINDSSSTHIFSGIATKANACDGAFKIVVDSEKLPYWVQKVTVDDKGTRVELDACVNSDGTTLYSFPVRFISENEVANADIEIYATVSDDESGATNVREVNWGVVNVDMSGTVTDYAEANPTIE